MANKKLSDSSIPVATSLAGLTLYGVKNGVTYQVPTSLFPPSGGTGGGGGVDPAPANTNTPTLFTDSLINIDRGTHIETSPLARAIFTTTATSVTINGYTNLASVAQPLAELGVLVNGAWLQSINPTADGSFSATLTLSAGSKTLEIVNGAQSKPAGAILGTFLKSVSGNAPFTLTTPPAGTRSVFLVDSIGVGDSASIPTRLSYISWLRRATTDSLIVYGWGYNGLLDIADTASTRGNLVSLIAAANPARVVIALGTNDYGLNKGAASTYQTAYTALNDAIHTALPSASIISVTPLLRATESANSFGNTLSSYRSAVTAAASGKSWVTVLDGTTFVPVSEMSDGLHPDDYGHWLYASAIDGQFGYTVPSYFNLPVQAIDANGQVTSLGAGIYRIAKVGGGTAFNSGFAGEKQTGDFRYMFDVAGLQDVMIGVSASPSASSGYADMTAQVYLEGSGLIISYNGATSAGSLGNYTASERLWINRTGSTVTFKKGPNYSSGTVLRTVTVSGDTYLKLSKASLTGTLDVTPGAADGAAVAPISAGPNTSVTEPSAGVYRVTKTAGGAGFNAGAYGASQPGNFRYKITIPALADVFVGVNPSPVAATGFGDMDLAIYFEGSGFLKSFAEGTDTGSLGSYAAGDVVWIDRTNLTTTFKKGATYDTAVNLFSGAAAGSIALDVSIFTQGATIDIEKVS